MCAFGALKKSFPLFFLCSTKNHIRVLQARNILLGRSRWRSPAPTLIHGRSSSSEVCRGGNSTPSANAQAGDPGRRGVESLARSLSWPGNLDEEEEESPHKERFLGMWIKNSIVKRSSSTLENSPSFSDDRPPWVQRPSAASLALAHEVAEKFLVGSSGFMRPLDPMWVLSSGFGPRWGRHHNGVDLAAPGEPVLAADSGEVTYAGWEPGGYGNLVEITHRDGWKTLYAHNSEIFTWEGRQVMRGECIASVGETGRATGPHLHWEIRDKFGHPVDPSKYVNL